MKTIQCPSCGATATNHKNCEFCSSIFVRAEQVGYDVSKLFKDNEIDIVFEGLKEAIDENILNQSKYRNISGQVGTNIFSSKSFYEIDNTNYILGLWNSDYEKDPLRGEVSIVFEISMLSEKHKLLLSQLEEFKLFDDVDSDGLWQIHFGNDSRGAAFLTSKILKNVYGLDYSAKLFFDQQVYSNKPTYNDLLKEFEEQSHIKDSSKEQGKGSCFIATATMGSYDHSEVMELRNFRDKWILEKKWGESFVKWYYHYGSISAKSIEKSFVLKKICYLLIVKPLVYLSRIVKK
jgi:hypothetical protein